MNNQEPTVVTAEQNSALTFPMQRAAFYIANSRAENTRRCYRGDVGHFVAWCESKSLPAMPAAPATVAMYIADLAEVAKVTTITRRLAAISKAHQAAGFESPCSLKNAVVCEVWPEFVVIRDRSRRKDAATYGSRAPDHPRAT